MLLQLTRVLFFKHHSGKVNALFKGVSSNTEHRICP